MSLGTPVAIPVADQEDVVRVFDPMRTVLLPFAVPKSVPAILNPVPGKPVFGATDFTTGLLTPHPAASTRRRTKTGAKTTAWVLFMTSIPFTKSIQCVGYFFDDPVPSFVFTTLSG